MRKGYWFVLLTSLFIAISQPIKNELFVLTRDEVDLSSLLVLKIAVLFLTFFIPGCLLTRWYYRKKDEKNH